MVEKISDKTLYHVTVSKPYKQALQPNAHLDIGATVNPFFGFYESARVYPVTQQDGSSVDVKAIHFLRLVFEGKLNCPTLPRIALEVAQHYVMLTRELLMEEIRRTEFNSEPPSRQTCLYCCDSLELARYWLRRIGDTNASICALRCSGTIHRADARLLLAESEPLSLTRERARLYWRGGVGSEPEIETLFVGRAVVTGTDL